MPYLSIKHTFKRCVHIPPLLKFNFFFFMVISFYLPIKQMWGARKCHKPPIINNNTN